MCKIKYFISVFLLFLFSSCSHASEKSSVIDASKILKEIKKENDILFSNKRITGNLNFINVFAGNEESIGELRNYIRSSITFRNCIFEGSVIAFEKRDSFAIFTVFEKNITFINCKFIQDVNFRDCDVEGSINFTDSEFHESAIFEGINGKGRTISFNSCTFHGKTKFQRSTFHSNAGFFKANFEQGANFQAAYFYKDAIFRSCTFGAQTNFSSIASIGKFTFNYSTFADAFTLQNVNSFETVELMNCNFNKIELKGNNFYANVLFTKSSFDATLQITDCIFHTGKPVFTEASFSNDYTLDIKNTVVKSSDKLELIDITNK